MIDRSKKLNDNGGYISGKMVNDLSPRKTMIVLVIVIGCFAVLWPKVFYPMLVGSANDRMKPSPIDRTQGCCDVISERDVTTIKVMSDICNTIIQKNEEAPMSNKELISKCQNLILETCGIDISAVLQEKVRLGHTTKQILEEIRSLNGSLCLKYNFGVAPWKLGVLHRVTVKVLPSYSIRQERPLHLRSEMVHPAFRERGRAIPQTESFSPTKPAPPSRLIPKIVEGRPGPIPGMRPTLGGAGHVVPPSKHGGNSMGLIMPIYTIGIVVFFTYTVMKIVFKKQPEVLYPSVEPDPHFRREVFEADRGHMTSRISKDSSSSKLVVNAMSALLDEVDMELSSRRNASEVDQQDVKANGNVVNQDDDQGSVQVLGMETTASCEGGQKWTRPASPLLPSSHTPLPPEPVTPPQEIFLEGSLPPQSHLLVTDSATEAQKVDYEEDPAVVLAGKMTLSVISLDSTENGTDESSGSSKKHEDRSSSNVSEEFEKIDIAFLEEQINDISDIQATPEIVNEEKPMSIEVVEEPMRNEIAAGEEKQPMLKEKEEQIFLEGEEAEEKPTRIEIADAQENEAIMAEIVNGGENQTIGVEIADADEKEPMMAEIVDTGGEDEVMRVEIADAGQKEPMMAEIVDAGGEDEVMRVEIADAGQKELMMAEIVDAGGEDEIMRVEIADAGQKEPMMAEIVDAGGEDEVMGVEIAHADEKEPMMAEIVDAGGEDEVEEAESTDAVERMIAEIAHAAEEEKLTRVITANAEAQEPTIMKTKKEEPRNAEIVETSSEESILKKIVEEVLPLGSTSRIDATAESTSKKDEDDENSEEIVTEVVEYVSDEEEEEEEIEEEVDEEEEEVEDEENESEDEEIEYEEKLDHA